MNPEFMRLALHLAQEHALAGEGGPFGAVVVRAGTVIAQGWNRVIRTHDPTAHAEMEAIREASRILGTPHLAGCEIYASCEPCPMCLAACYWARLERIYFAATRTQAADAGFDDSLLYREIAAPMSDRQLPILPLLPEESHRPFEAWRALPGHRLY